MEEHYQCPGCGSLGFSKDVTCPQCGYQATRSGAKKRLNPLRALALLLAFLFLVSLYPFYMTFIDIDPRHIYLDDYATQEDWDRMAVTLGLDKPYPQQYGRFLKSVLTGDLGWAEIRLSY